MKYLSIPVEVEAIQFDKTMLGELQIFTQCRSCSFMIDKNGTYTCTIGVNGVRMKVTETDYVVKDEDGNISVMKQALFESSYVKKE